MDDHTVRTSYGAVTGEYVRLFGTVDATHDDDLALIRRGLGTCSGPVLDAGCGPGHLTAYLHGLGVEVRGIDLVPEFVEHARSAWPGCRFDVGSLRELESGDGMLGGILAWYSLIHLPPDDVPAVLAEFRRVLRPGGALVVGFFVGETVEPFAHKVTTAYRWPVDTFTRALADAGFTVMGATEVRPADGMNRPHAALAAVAGPSYSTELPHPPQKTPLPFS